MFGVAPALSDPVRVGLVGAGRIGTSHATLLARRVPGARLVAVADPRPEAAQALAASLGCRAAGDADELFADPEIEAVVITASSEAHADLVVAAAAAGKAVFCEKPMGLTLEDVDRGIAAASAAGVALQVGFNRRFSADFAAAHQLVARRPHRHAAADAVADPRPGAGQPGRRPAVDRLPADPHPRLRHPALAEPRRRAARRSTPPPTRSSPPSSRTPACSTPRSSSSPSTTAPSRPPRPASPPPTATTSAARSSAPRAW